MRKKSCLALLIIVVSFLPAVAWSYVPRCALSFEQRAFNIQVMQTELMVAALSCKENDRYNQFILKFTPELKAYQETLIHYFTRYYQKEANNQMIDFTTKLANAISKRTLYRSEKNYCKGVKQSFDHVLDMGKTELENISYKSRSDLHQIPMCQSLSKQDFSNLLKTYKK